MTKKFSIAILTVLAMTISNEAKAFDWGNLKNLFTKDNVENVINGVISNDNIDVDDLEGSWAYKAPAIAFESEDVLKKTGGIAMATTIENKIAPYYKKVGLNNFTFTCDAEGNFTMAIKKAKLTGTITKEDDVFVFNFNALGKTKAFKMNAYIKKGTTLEITFNASKLISLINTLANISGNSTAKSLASTLNSYEGLYAGFEMSKN